MLNHDKLVKLVGVIAESQPQLVLEWMNGGDLCLDFHVDSPSLIAKKNKAKEHRKSVSKIEEDLQSLAKQSEELDLLLVKLQQEKNKIMTKGDVDVVVFENTKEISKTEQEKITLKKEIVQKESQMREELNKMVLVAHEFEKTFYEEKKQVHKQISEQVRLKVMYDIACGMRYLHSRTPPVAHLDLRSPNIFVTTSLLLVLFLFFLEGNF
jgi:serine/threonine protein kinase